MIIVAVFITATITAQTATAPAVGDGSSGDPYQIATLDNLYWLTQNSSEWNKNFIQTTDIDASSTSTWDAGAGFSPIGNYTINFTGTYNGQNHTIDALYINRTAEWEMGMFAFTSSSTIENLGLTNIDITGLDIVGGLVGYHNNNSNINNSYVTGSVTGDDYVGGLVGQNMNNSGISYSYTNCITYGTDFTGGFVGLNDQSAVSTSYSMGSVSCEHRVGGFVGENKYSISNCYSTCTVNATGMYVGGFVGTNNSNGAIYDSYCTGDVSSTDTYVGGFAGQNESASIIRSYTISNVVSGATYGGFCRTGNGTITQCFWNIETTNATTSAGGIGKTTAQMKNLCTYIDGVEASWDFAGETANGSYDWWGLNASENGAYPYLAWQGYTHTEECCGFDAPTGSGTSIDPYQIATICDLKWLSEHNTEWDKYYIQIADIDATETNTWNVGDHDLDGSTPDQAMGFSPIGNNSVEFTGAYNATGHAISNLYINTTNNDEQALFGRISGSTIENIAVVNADITGDNAISCIVATSLNSTISNSYSNGTINSYYLAGGIAGENNGSTIENCYSFTTINAVNYAGGIAGYNTSSATISNSYSAGLINSTGSKVGGLVGDVSSSTTTNSFWDTETSEQTTSAGGIGKTTAEMQTMCIYVDGIEAAWDFMNSTTNGSEDIWGINSSVNNGYPFLAWQGFSHTGICCGFNQALPTVVANASATTVCAGEEVTLYGSGANTYIWDNGVTDNVAFTPSGTMTYTVTGSDGNCENTAQIDVVVTPLPEQPIITLSGSDLISSATTGNQWYYGATLLSGETNQLLTPASNGDYYVELTENGCSIMSEVYNYYATEISEIDNNSFEIYPNPANNFIVIENTNAEKASILDITGKLIKEINLNNDKTIIDISDLNQGVFFVKIENNIQKLIVK